MQREGRRSGGYREGRSGCGIMPWHVVEQICYDMDGIAYLAGERIIIYSGPSNSSKI